MLNSEWSYSWFVETLNNLWGVYHDSSSRKLISFSYRFCYFPCLFVTAISFGMEKKMSEGITVQVVHLLKEKSDKWKGELSQAYAKTWCLMKLFPDSVDCICARMIDFFFVDIPFVGKYALNQMLIDVCDLLWFSPISEDVPDIAWIYYLLHLLLIELSNGWRLDTPSHASIIISYLLYKSYNGQLKQKGWRTLREKGKEFILVVEGWC